MTREILTKNLPIDDLKKAINFYNSWVKVKMLQEIPDAAFILNQVKSVTSHNNYEQIDNYSNQILKKETALSKLNSIKNRLGSMNESNMSANDNKNMLIGFLYSVKKMSPLQFTHILSISSLPKSR